MPHFRHVLAMLVVAWLTAPAALAQQPPPQQQAQPPAPPHGTQLPPSPVLPGFVELARPLIPAVVNISATVPAPAAAEPGAPPSPPGPGGSLEDFFRDFFGPRQPDPDAGPPRQRAAVGSGFVIDPAGYIVTNNHVVDGAETVTVVLHDESEHRARVVGTDARTDLALLKIEPSAALPHVRWGDSEAAEVGEAVLAIGNPFGLGGTVTAGIISARARDLGVGPYDEFLQTDASINRGNSGGPLFNMRGEVIGVTTAIFSPTGANIGIGFAIPASLAQSVIRQLRETGEVRRGWIGVSIQRLNEDLAAALGLDTARGALVADVIPNAPARQADIRIGDVILEFAGRPIDQGNRLARVVADTAIGETVPVRVWRDGAEATLKITVGDLSQAPGVAQAPEPSAPPPPEPNAQTGLGLSLAPLSPQARQALDIDAAIDGVLVEGVEEGSAAAESGARRGDVILRVGRREVAQPGDVNAALRQARSQGQRHVLLLVRRGDGNRFLSVPVAPG